MIANSATAAQNTVFTVISRPSRIIPDHLILCSASFRRPQTCSRLVRLRQCTPPKPRAYRWSSSFSHRFGRAHHRCGRTRTICRGATLISAPNQARPETDHVHTHSPWRQRGFALVHIEILIVRLLTGRLTLSPSASPSPSPPPSSSPRRTSQLSPPSSPPPLSLPQPSGPPRVGLLSC